MDYGSYGIDQRIKRTAKSPFINDSLFRTRVSSSRGFTLIELLIVIAVAGIITAVVFGSLSVSRRTSRDTKRVGDLKTIQLALAIYYDVNRVYPVNLAVLATDKYLPALPTDPGSGTYDYLRYSSNRKYCLSATLETTPVPNDDVSATNANCSPLAGNYKVSK